MSNNDLPSTPKQKTPLMFPRRIDGLPASELSDEEIAALRTAMMLAPGAQPRGKSCFPLFPVGELQVRPPRWLVRDLFETESLVVLFGPPGSAKSFLALDLAACIATGTAFHGRPVARAGFVVYVAGEGHSGIARRLRAWSIARRVGLESAPLLISGGPAGLCAPESVQAVEEAIAEAVKTWGPPVLLIFDTWARNLSGDENSSLDSGLGVAAVDRLRKPWEAAALVVHHEGWTAGRARGSTVLRGAADLELRMERGEDGLVRVEATKIKDVGPSAPLAFSFADVDLGLLDEDGRPVSSAVLEEEDYCPEEGARAPSGKNQRLALEVLEAEIARHRANVKASGRDPAIARVSVSAWRDACLDAGLQKNRFYQVKSSLLDSRSIVLDGDFVSLPSKERPESAFPHVYIHAEKSGLAELPKSGQKRNGNGIKAALPQADLPEMGKGTFPFPERCGDGATWESLGVNPEEAPLDLF